MTTPTTRPGLLEAAELSKGLIDNLKAASLMANDPNQRRDIENTLLGVTDYLAAIRAAAAKLPETRGDKWTLIAPDGRTWTGLSPLNAIAAERNERMTATEQLENISAGIEAEHQAEVKRMVDRFLGWPLPKSVRPDDCVMDQNYSHSRCGTNLLTATEATQMIEYMLAAASKGAGDE